ncbi:unnamed protein product, partial [Prorocentrum cordatum]
SLSSRARGAEAWRSGAAARRKPGHMQTAAVVCSTVRGHAAALPQRHTQRKASLPRRACPRWTTRWTLRRAGARERAPCRRRRSRHGGPRCPRHCGGAAGAGAETAKRSCGRRPARRSAAGAERRGDAWRGCPGDPALPALGAICLA